MAGAEPIPDKEIVLRHIPGGSTWQAPGSRITSGNFSLRHDRGETGISVTRRNLTSPERLLELVGGDITRGSRVTAAGVSSIRAIGLRVVAKPRAEDAGHAEIQSDAASLDDHATRKRLASLFQFLP